MVQILEGDKGNIDFSDSIDMNKNQFKKFIKMLKSLFAQDVVKVEKSSKTRKERLGDKKRFQRKWSPEERKYLFEFKNNEEIAQMLGRSEMSVMAQRVKLLPRFKKWARKRGYDILREDLEEMIKEYMEEKELKKERRKNLRKQMKNTKEVIKNLRKDNKRLNRMKKRRPPEDMKIKIENKISENKNKISELKEKIKELKEDMEKLR